METKRTFVRTYPYISVRSTLKLLVLLWAVWSMHKVLHVFRACTISIIKQTQCSVLFKPYDHRRSQFHNKMPFLQKISLKWITERVNARTAERTEWAKWRGDETEERNSFETREAKKISDSSCECSLGVQIKSNACHCFLASTSTFMCVITTENIYSIPTTNEVVISVADSSK